MATTELKNDVATTLLEAIAKAAPGANSRGAEAIESLARAYAAVVSADPRQPGRSTII